MQFQPQIVLKLFLYSDRSIQVFYIVCGASGCITTGLREVLMEMGINFRSNDNKSVLIMKVREVRSELHRNDDSDGKFTAADEAIKVSTHGLLCDKVQNEKPFGAS